MYVCICLTDSPPVTPEATGRLLTTVTSLRDVTLHGAGVISETVLSALHGCSQLDTVQLNDTRPLTYIPALTQSEVAAVSRSVGRTATADIICIHAPI